MVWPVSRNWWYLGPHGPVLNITPGSGARRKIWPALKPPSASSGAASRAPTTTGPGVDGHGFSSESPLAEPTIPETAGADVRFITCLPFAKRASPVTSSGAASRAPTTTGPGVDTHAFSSESALAEPTISESAGADRRLFTCCPGFAMHASPVTSNKWAAMIPSNQRNSASDPA
eukprot:CAMPEP_0178454858 /NCGR_PEP_ID=MMETSP0689_2-20121128/45597_1 /TAXON_ID=160604 /ORGANISM="Amphidinium massartii, Strain CS-259" /LENGTH=173 /DNA_ID=CAMNT_0020080849 /DNA_START=50 /DNA_END=571 /DNA_ORIENTATION=-